jgi:hypothetical protein
LILEFNLILISQTTDFFHTRFGLELDETANSIIASKKKGYLIVGQTNSMGSLNTDIYLARTDTFGLPIWQKHFGGFQPDIANSVVELSDTSFVISGYTSSYGNGGYDALIARFNKDGILMWIKTFGGLDWDFANKINLTHDGNLIVCGSTYSFGRGGEDAFVIKLDLNGNILWQKIYGGLNNDDFHSIKATSDGGFIACGTTKSYGDILGDIWVAKLTLNGDSVWFKTYGGNKVEVGKDIVEDKFNDYVFVGGSESFSNGKLDAIIYKTNSVGVEDWYRFFGLSSEDETVLEVINSNLINGGYVIIYQTKEIPFYKLDTKSLLLDKNGYYINGGRVGSTDDEEVMSVGSSYDKGYVVAGYSKGFGATNKDIFIVKFDSTMNGPGALYVGLNKGSNQEKDDNELQITPSIFIDRVKIIRNKELKINKVELYSINGQRVFELTEPDDIIKFNEFLPAGVYLIYVYTKENIVIRKLIKK